MRDAAFPREKTVSGGDSGSAHHSCLALREAAPTQHSSMLLQPRLLSDCYLMEGGTEKVLLAAPEPHSPREEQRGPAGRTWGLG